MDDVGDAMGRVAHPCLGGAETGAGNLIAAKDVVKRKADPITGAFGFDAADDQVVHPEQTPVAEIHILVAGRHVEHVPRRQGTKPAGARQIGTDDRSDIDRRDQTLVDTEGHDGDGLGGLDPAGHLDVESGSGQRLSQADEDQDDDEQRTRWAGVSSHVA
jgi:hypothetical protein